MSSDELQRAIEEAEDAARDLKHQLERARATVAEARARLGGDPSRRRSGLSSDPGSPDDGPSVTG